MANIKQISIGNTTYDVKDAVSGYQTETQVNTIVNNHHDSTKQDVLTAVAPISIAQITVGAMTNFTTAGTTATPTYTQLEVSDEWGELSFTNNQMSTTPTDFNDFCNSGTLSYFDIPVDFATDFYQSGQTVSFRVAENTSGKTLFMFGSKATNVFTPMFGVLCNQTYSDRAGFTFNQVNSTNTGYIKYSSAIGNFGWDYTTSSTSDTNNLVMSITRNNDDFRLNSTIVYNGTQGVSSNNQWTMANDDWRAKWATVNCVRVFVWGSVNTTNTTYKDWSLANSTQTFTNISVGYDNNTIKVNASNQLYADVQSAPETDNTTISLNASSKLQAIGVIDAKTGNSDKIWTGTQEEYKAITTKDDNTLYATDGTDITLAVLQELYPVGALYFGTMATCPLATLGIGTWQLVATDRVIQGAGTRGSVGTTVNESLPNITGNTGLTATKGITYDATQNGAFVQGTNLGNVPYVGASGTSANCYLLGFNANNSSSTYQDNAPVQQNAYLVNIWERIA